MTADPELAGLRVHIAYGTGYEFDVHYLSADRLQWRATAGPTVGASGLESIHSMQVAPGVFWLNWVEADGTTLSQLVNVPDLTITAFMTFAGAAGGRDSIYHSGKLTILAGA
jgi:MoaF-like